MAQTPENFNPLNERENIMSKPIYLVGGSKGGVGKSMVTMALIDYLQTKGESVFLIETDTSNADVWKAYNSETKSELINLEEGDGWMNLIEIANDENYKESSIVINTRAANNQGVDKYGETLNSMLKEIGRELIVFWVINRQRDSLELLKTFRAALPDALVHVVRNSYFGEERKYQLYNSSNIREEVEASGGKSLTFPDMADLLADNIYINRLSIAKASVNLTLGSRAEIQRWKSLVSIMFKEVDKS